MLFHIFKWSVFLRIPDVRSNLRKRTRMLVRPFYKLTTFSIPALKSQHPFFVHLHGAYSFLLIVNPSCGAIWKPFVTAPSRSTGFTFPFAMNGNRSTTEVQVHFFGRYAATTQFFYTSSFYFTFFFIFLEVFIVFIFLFGFFFSRLFVILSFIFIFYFKHFKDIYLKLISFEIYTCTLI